MEPCDLLSNSGKWLRLKDLSYPWKYARFEYKIPSEEGNLLVGVSFRQTRLVYPGIARHHTKRTNPMRLEISSNRPELPGLQE